MPAYEDGLNFAVQQVRTRGAIAWNSAYAQLENFAIRAYQPVSKQPTADKAFSASVVNLLQQQQLAETWLAQSSASSAAELVNVAAQACLDVSGTRKGQKAALQSVFADRLPSTQVNIWSRCDVGV